MVADCQLRSKQTTALQIKEELVRTSFSSPEAANIQGERGKIRKQYSDGERKVAYLTLQCVGFNEELYNALLEARSPQLREAEQHVALVRTTGKRRRQGGVDSGRAAKMLREDGGDGSETEKSGDDEII